MYMFRLPRQCRASDMYLNYNLPNLSLHLIRRNIFGVIQRLSISQKLLLSAI